jgi:peroxiredoxin (alkyl hydroperoxide reductase subunit C)
VTLSVGQPAPDFELIGTLPQPLKLSSLRGEKTAVVVFFELAFNDDCVAELQAFQELLPEFEAANAQVMAISIDPVGILQGFAGAYGLTFPLLTASLHYQTLHDFGVFQDSQGFASVDGGMAARVTYVIDKEGIIRGKVEGESDMRAYAEQALKVAQEIQ